MSNGERKPRLSMGALRGSMAASNRDNGKDGKISKDYRVRDEYQDRYSIHPLRNAWNVAGHTVFRAVPPADSYTQGEFNIGLADSEIAEVAPPLYPLISVDFFGKDKKTAIAFFAGLPRSDGMSEEEAQAYADEYNPYVYITKTLLTMKDNGTLPQEWEIYITDTELPSGMKRLPIFASRNIFNARYFTYVHIYRESLKRETWHLAMNGVPLGMNGPVLIGELSSQQYKSMYSAVMKMYGQEEDSETSNVIDPYATTSAPLVYTYRGGSSPPGDMRNTLGTANVYETSLNMRYIPVTKEENDLLKAKLGQYAKSTLKLHPAISRFEIPNGLLGKDGSKKAANIERYKPLDEVLNITTNEECMELMARAIPEMGVMCEKVLKGDMSRMMKLESVQGYFSRRELFDMNNIRLELWDVMCARDAAFNKKDDGPSERKPSTYKRQAQAAKDEAFEEKDGSYYMEPDDVPFDTGQETAAQPSAEKSLAERRREALAKASAKSEPAQESFPDEITPSESMESAFDDIE